MQEGVILGSIAIFIIRVYHLSDNILHYRPAIQGVSNQYFNITIDDLTYFDEERPIVPDEEFNEIYSSIKYIFSLYSALKQIKI